MDQDPSGTTRHILLCRLPDRLRNRGQRLPHGAATQYLDAWRVAQAAANQVVPMPSCEQESNDVVLVLEKQDLDVAHPRALHTPLRIIPELMVHETNHASIDSPPGVAHTKQMAQGCRGIRASMRDEERQSERNVKLRPPKAQRLRLQRSRRANQLKLYSAPSEGAVRLERMA